MVARLVAILPDSRQTLLLGACLHQASNARDEWLRTAERYDDEQLGPAGALLPLLFAAMKRHRTRAGRSTRQRLREAFLRAAAESARYEQGCRDALAALSCAGLPYLVLKGAALRELVYPAPMLRPCGDLDLLVAEKDLRAAADALHRRGWRRRDPGFDIGTQHIPPLVHPTGVSIDLHRRLLPSSYYSVPLTELWERSAPCTLLGVPARTLCAADHLIHVCGHASGCETRRSLRWACDAWLLLASHPRLDWEQLFDTTVKSRLELPLAITMGYLTFELGAPIPPAIVSRLWNAAATIADPDVRVALFKVPEAFDSGATGVQPRGWRAHLRSTRKRLLPTRRELSLVHGIERSRVLYSLSRAWSYAARRLKHS